MSLNKRATGLFTIRISVDSGMLLFRTLILSQI